MKINKKNQTGPMAALLAALIAAAAFLLAGCGKKEWRPGQPLAKERVRIGVLHVSDPRTETSGYAYAHAAGIEEMRKNMGLAESQIDNVYNLHDEDIPATESAMRDCIVRGANIIIATSWGYMDSCEKLAAEFPGVIFAHASGYKFNAANFTNYFGRVYQARYLSGIAAGLKTKTGKIGYVAAMGKDNSEVTGGSNAFALGVEKANPAARIYVKVTYSWFDPMGEAAAARALIAAGCDVIAQHCDTALPQIEVDKAGVWGIGYNSDMSKEAPGAVLTSVVWHWGVYYTGLVESVINGTFTTAPYFGGLAQGVVDITPLARELAAPETATMIEAERRRIVEEGFNVFEGLLETNAGRITGTEGGTLSDSDITGAMNWYYRNVIE
jgi:basic membrane protein A